MAHIQEGAPGKNGPPIITLEKSAASSRPVPAGSKLTGAQYKSFKAGHLYFNPREPIKTVSYNSFLIIYGTWLTAVISLLCAEAHGCNMVGAGARRALIARSCKR